jgi:hypothetical protein
MYYVDHSILAVGNLREADECKLGLAENQKNEAANHIVPTHAHAQLSDKFSATQSDT